MNFLNVNPVGIDLEINRYQKRLYSMLSKKWGDIEGYGRIYKNIKGDGNTYEPEYFLGNEDYKSVLGCETTKFFFVKGDSRPTVSTECVFNASVDIYFLVNLNIIDPEKRADEQSLMDVIQVLRSLSVRVEGIKQGIKVLFNDFNKSISKDQTNLKFSDLQPGHIFKIETTMQYSLD